MDRDSPAVERNGTREVRLPLVVDLTKMLRTRATKAGYLRHPPSQPVLGCFRADKRVTMQLAPQTAKELATGLALRIECRKLQRLAWYMIDAIAARTQGKPSPLRCNRKPKPTGWAADPEHGGTHSVLPMNFEIGPGLA